MIFYNGFNMLIDVVLITIASLFFYRSGWWAGYKAGIIDTHEEDERWLAETSGDYWLEQSRIADKSQE